jgi:hypothetical protein
MHRPPAVTCSSCDRAWHSETLLEGLALVGACPRCGGELVFHRTPSVDEPERGGRFARTEEPHLVLGRPRGRRRRA